MTTNPYERLGVSPDASDREVRSAWLRCMRAVHPDRFGGADDIGIEYATVEAQAVNAAYAEIKRLRNQRAEASAPPDPPRPPPDRGAGPRGRAGSRAGPGGRSRSGAGGPSPGDAGPRRARPSRSPGARSHTTSDAGPPPGSSAPPGAEAGRAARPAVGATVFVHRSAGARKGRVTAVDPSGHFVSVRLYITERGRRPRLSSRTLRVPASDIWSVPPRARPSGGLIGRTVTVRRPAGDRRGKVDAVDPAGRFADVRLYIKRAGRRPRLSSRTLRVPMSEIVAPA